MDQEWIPASLHRTLREVLGFHLRLTLGYYYRWAARRAFERARREGLPVVVELGAGAAGFSETLARLIREERSPLKVEISDLRPDAARYRELEVAFPGILTSTPEPIDFIRGPYPPDNALVVMSAAFHHIPPESRREVLQALARRRVSIYESVTRKFLAIVGCAIGFLPALATPVYFWGTRLGRWRRVFWCWVVPAAPLMVAFDGVVSCLRCWDVPQWREQLSAAGVAPATIRSEDRRFSHVIEW